MWLKLSRTSKHLPNLHSRIKTLFSSREELQSNPENASSPVVSEEKRPSGVRPLLLRLPVLVDEPPCPLFGSSSPSSPTTCATSCRMQTSRNDVKSLLCFVGSLLRMNFQSWQRSWGSSFTMNLPLRRDLNHLMFKRQGSVGQTPPSLPCCGDTQVLCIDTDTRILRIIPQ